MGYLCKSEIKEIYKRLEYQNSFNNQEYFECPINLIPITPGDIIYKENNAYLIYEKDKQNLRAFLYNKKSRKCNYKERYTIPNTKELTRYRIGSITLEELRKVLNLYKKDLEEAKEFKEISEKEIEIEPGTIICYRKEYYYVNYCFPDKLLCFWMRRRNDFSQIKDYPRIRVGNKEYYVFMKYSKDIQTKEDFKIIATASQEEKEFIRELKKHK